MVLLFYDLLMNSTATVYDFFRLGSRYEGRCAVCRKTISGFELGIACVYSHQPADPKRKTEYVIAHAPCVGGSTKHSGGGQIKFRKQPQEQLTVVRG